MSTLPRRLCPGRRFSLLSLQKHKNFENMQKRLSDSYRASNFPSKSLTCRFERVKLDERVDILERSEKLLFTIENAYVALEITP